MHNEFEVTSYLQCNSLHKEVEESSGLFDTLSSVLDSSKVLAFLRNIQTFKKGGTQGGWMAKKDGGKLK